MKAVMFFASLGAAAAAGLAADAGETQAAFILVWCSAQLLIFANEERK